MAFFFKMLAMPSKTKLKDLRHQPSKPKATSCPASDSSSDEEDSVVDNAPCQTRNVPRRGAEAGSVLQSSACADSALSSYTRMRVVHRGRHSTILLAFEIEGLKDVVIKAFRLPCDGQTHPGGVTEDDVMQEFNLMTRLANGDDVLQRLETNKALRDFSPAAYDHQLDSGPFAGSLSDEFSQYLASSSCSSAAPPSASLCPVPGVVRPLAHFKVDQHAYIVQEYCPGVNVVELMGNHGGRMREITCCALVVYPLLLTLSALHAADIVHRQVQPEHVLCHDGRTYLIDFHKAANKRTRHLNERVGTLEYMAPEVLSKPLPEEIFATVLELGTSEDELPTYDERCDIWSLGVLVFEAMTGRQPFNGETVDEMAVAQVKALAKCPDTGMPQLIAREKQLSPAAKDFLCRTLQLDPARRASASQLLQHTWLDQLVSVHNVQEELRQAGGRTRRSFSSGLIIPT